MDYDSSSPAAKYFKDDQFVVRSSEARTQEAILWLSYSEIEGTINLGAYDPTIGDYSHQFSGGAGQVDAFIDSVEAAYGVKVPKSFRTGPKKFLTLASDSFGLEVDLDEEPTECETCGSNQSVIQAFYFPAISSTIPASIAVHNEYGCFGGNGIYGRADDVKDEAIRILEGAAIGSDVESSAAEVREFIEKLKAV